ncbi:hypothetical protein [Sphingobacterium pedocola]|nr:hypothetical protein [Sphingobacterium pedocola]
MLFGYLNMLCYEVRFDDFVNLNPIEANETLLELVFEEMFDLENPDASAAIPEIIYDEYQIIQFSLGVMPAELIFGWLLCMIFLLAKTTPLFNRKDKTQNRPGYYSFLYRYRPF